MNRQQPPKSRRPSNPPSTSANRPSSQPSTNPQSQPQSHSPPPYITYLLNLLRTSSSSSTITPQTIKTKNFKTPQETLLVIAEFIVILADVLTNFIQPASSGAPEASPNPFKNLKPIDKLLLITPVLSLLQNHSHNQRSSSLFSPPDGSRTSDLPFMSRILTDFKCHLFKNFDVISEMLSNSNKTETIDVKLISTINTATNITISDVPLELLACLIHYLRSSGVIKEFRDEVYDDSKKLFMPPYSYDCASLSGVIDQVTTEYVKERSDNKTKKDDDSEMLTKLNTQIRHLLTSITCIESGVLNQTSTFKSIQSNGSKSNATVRMNKSTPLVSLPLSSSSSAFTLFELSLQTPQTRDIFSSLKHHINSEIKSLDALTGADGVLECEGLVFKLLTGNKDKRTGVNAKVIDDFDRVNIAADDDETEAYKHAFAKLDALLAKLDKELNRRDPLFAWIRGNYEDNVASYGERDKEQEKERRVKLDGIAKAVDLEFKGMFRKDVERIDVGLTNVDKGGDDEDEDEERNITFIIDDLLSKAVCGGEVYAALSKPPVKMKDVYVGMCGDVRLGEALLKLPDKRLRESKTLNCVDDEDGDLDGEMSEEDEATRAERIEILNRILKAGGEIPFDFVAS